MKERNMILMFTIVMFGIIIFSLLTFNQPDDVARSPKVVIIEEDDERDVPPIRLKEEKVFNELTRQEEYTYTTLTEEEIEQMLEEAAYLRDENGDVVTDDEDGTMMFSTGPTPNPNPQIDCKNPNCYSRCTSYGFEEGKCLSNRCYCLNQVHKKYSVQECDNYCPGDNEFTLTLEEECSCHLHNNDIHYCRFYGDEVLNFAGSVIYRVVEGDLSNESPDTISHKVEQQYANICVGNTLISSHCTEDQFTHRSDEIWTNQQIKDKTIEVVSTPCEDAVDCGEENRLFMPTCEGGECVCAYKVDKTFLKNAINIYLMNFKSGITKEDINLLIKVYSRHDLSAVEEKRVPTLIKKVQEETRNEMINFDVLY